MRLAEALQERADLNRKIEQLKVRLLANCLMQEGEEPAEDPNGLLTELDAATMRLGDLIAAINLTNCTTLVDGRTLTQIIAEKDALGVQLGAYRSAVHEASQKTQRFSRNEIRILSAVDVRKLQGKADGIAKRIRQLDNALQENNWKVDVQGL